MYIRFLDLHLSAAQIDAIDKVAEAEYQLELDEEEAQSQLDEEEAQSQLDEEEQFANSWFNV